MDAGLTPLPPFPWGRAVRQWWRESLRERGVWRTLEEAGVQGFNLLRDYMPARRRLRYGDIDFDCDFGVDTTWANVTLGTRLREILAGRQYQPTDPPLFREIITGLEIEYPEFTFVDLGSGKGRGLLLASEFPFRRIVGVELLPELHAIAQQNVRKFTSPAQRCNTFELWCGDARQFTFPPEPSVIFMFDPFSGHVLREVLANLGRSVEQRPRELIVIYQNPVQEEAFIKAAPFLKKTAGTIQYALFRNGQT
ncbi:MAG: hypothetical protein ACE14M_09645 [Terriglobales bacterium]